MELYVKDPIHLPCPDMAGCANPNPVLTQNSLKKVGELLAFVRSQMTKKTKTSIPDRFRQVCYKGNESC